MFDFRYHVASLAAVFIALVIGILVGVGLSGRGFVNDAERKNFQSRIADLEQQRDEARVSLEAASGNRQAVQGIARDTYDALVPGRLDGLRIAILYIGPVDQNVDFSLRKGVQSDGGGTIVRVREIHVPIRDEAIRSALLARPALRRYASARDLSGAGRELGDEFVKGVRTPLWAALSNLLVDEREGNGTAPVDGVVVVRTVSPQQGQTARFLGGLYQGLARAGAPAVGVEGVGAITSALPVLARSGLSTVSAVDEGAGRLALVLLLAGAQPGNYGVDENGRDGVIPPVPATRAG